MTEFKSSSRRSFLGKLGLGSMGLAFAPILIPQFAKGENHVSEKMAESDKKFVPVMLTPFKADGQVDYDILARLIDFYNATGVKGFFSICNSSEMYNLTPEERLSIARFVVKRVNGAKSVVATGSFGENIEDRSEFAKRMYNTGVNAVIMITSHFAKLDESDQVLTGNFDKFLTLTDNIPLGTYECPAPYKRILTPYSFKYLLDTNRVRYHKDTTIVFEKVKVKIDLAKNTRLEFYDACIANAMYSMQAGARGMSPICGNFYPEIITWICQNATDPGRQVDVKFIQEKLTKTEDIISQNYPLSAKYFLRKRGLPIEIKCRLESPPLSKEQQTALDQVHSDLLSWCDRIGIRLLNP